MDICKTIYDVLKDVGPTAWKYVKYQIRFQEFVGGFDEMKGRLQRRSNDIQSVMDSQLRQNGKIPKEEVAEWLQDVSRKIAAKDVEDIISSGGCFCRICRGKQLDDKTKELRALYEQGVTYTLGSQILVKDDPSVAVDFMRKFEEAKRSLQHRKGDIESTLNSQLLQNGKTEKLEVRDWLENAKEVIEIVEAQVNSCSPLQILEQKIRELNEVNERGATYTQPNQLLVKDDPSRKGVVLPSVKLCGRDSVLSEIMVCLKGEDVKSIAICGMGGMGKTTVMKSVNNQLMKESKFGRIIWVTISGDFNMLKIQNEIARQLKQRQEGISNTQQDEFFKEHHDPTWRAGMVSEMLLQGDHLLILDDVWENFPYGETGIPTDLENTSFKFVLTTRSLAVARAMDCQKIIPLEPLAKEEATELFLDMVGCAVLNDDGKIRKDLESTLLLVVKQCVGLPLALATVGRSMKGKSSHNLWLNALNELMTQGDKKDAIFNILKFSYDRLEDTNEQQCFLHCALYPEDYEIPKKALIEHWMEEGFIAEKKTRYEMICKGHAILKKLEDRCLLECIQAEYADDEEYRENVRIHDLLRAMALKITKTQFLVKAGKGLTELPEEDQWTSDIQKVSLMVNHIEEIPSAMPFSNCTKITTLLLSKNRFRKIPESFFENMPGLKILDLSYNRMLTALPSSVSKLMNLTTLLLQWCDRLEELPPLSNFRVLTRLNLCFTGLKKLPQGLETLGNLKFLDMSKLHELMNVEVEGERLLCEILPNLLKLQYLGVDAKFQLKGEVIRRLVKLEVVIGWFPTMHDWSTFAKSRSVDLNRYCLALGEADYNFHMECPMKCIICSEIDFCGESDFLLPANIKELEISSCNNLRNFNEVFTGFQGTPDLLSLCINSCEDMESVFTFPWLRLNPLQCLNSLDLGELKKLTGLLEARGMAKSELPPGTFSSLKKISITDCDRIKKLIPPKLLGYLQNLEEIIANGCKQMEELIGSEEEDEERVGVFKLVLPRLKSMELVDMPSLKSICSPTAGQLVCDSLKQLSIVGCPNLNCQNVERVFGSCFNPLQAIESLRVSDVQNMISVFDEEALVLPTPPPATLFPLTTIHVSSCHRLNRLFSPRLIQRILQNLKEIQIGDCQQMEEIISSSSEEEEGLQLSLPNLITLELTDLPSLQSICSSSSVLICNSLTYSGIIGPPKLKRIPLYLPQLDNGRPSHPPSLKDIEISTSIWKSLEWDHPLAKEVLLPFCLFDEEEQ